MFFPEFTGDARPYARREECRPARTDAVQYGRTKATSKDRKRNLVVATGKGLSAGTSNTLAIEMTYGSDAQPDIKAHMSHIEAWLRY